MCGLHLISQFFYRIIKKRGGGVDCFMHWGTIFLGPICQQTRTASQGYGWVRTTGLSRLHGRRWYLCIQPSSMLILVLRPGKGLQSKKQLKAYFLLIMSQECFLCGWTAYASDSPLLIPSFSPPGGTRHKWPMSQSPVSSHLEKECTIL